MNRRSMIQKSLVGLPVVGLLLGRTSFAQGAVATADPSKLLAEAQAISSKSPAIRTFAIDAATNIQDQSSRLSSDESRISVLENRTPAGGGTGGSLDWINVKANGAVGDGSTDDRAALQAIINSAPNGAVLYFPGAGVYRINAPLLHRAGSGLSYIGDGANIYGDTAGSVLSAGASGITIFDCYNGSGVDHNGFLMRDLAFRDPNGVSSSSSVQTSTVRGIRIAGTNNCRLDNLTFEQMGTGVAGTAGGGDCAYHMLLGLRMQHVGVGIDAYFAECHIIGGTIFVCLNGVGIRVSGNWFSARDVKIEAATWGAAATAVQVIDGEEIRFYEIKMEEIKTGFALTGGKHIKIFGGAFSGGGLADYAVNIGSGVNTSDGSKVGLYGFSSSGIATPINDPYGKAFVV